MLQIANAELVVSLLDPAKDQDRQGSRFCWGGYVWQVHDKDGLPLLTGPEWPRPTPSSFNGQGMPEAFRHRTRTGQPLTWEGKRGVGLGIGEMEINSKGEVDVTVPCRWDVTVDGANMVFRTEQQSGNYHYEIHRIITLDGRRLVSSSRLKNLSSQRLVLEWFAHPFFALSDRWIDVEVPAGSQLKENPGFKLEGKTLRLKRRFEHEKDGHMDFLQLPPGAVVEATLSHPQLEYVTFSTDFAPSECVIWANHATFSIEPYQKLSLDAGEEQSWTLRYGFGPRRA